MKVDAFCDGSARHVVGSCPLLRWLRSAKLTMKASIDFALSRPNVEFCIDGTPFTFGSC